jgi:hypothetical protein
MRKIPHEKRECLIRSTRMQREGANSKRLPETKVYEDTLSLLCSSNAGTMSGVVAFRLFCLLWIRMMNLVRTTTSVVLNRHGYHQGEQNRATTITFNSPVGDVSTITETTMQASERSEERVADCVEGMMQRIEMWLPGPRCHGFCMFFWVLREMGVFFFCSWY